MTDYDQQAQDFLDKTGTNTQVKLGTFPYFDDDKDVD